ncbi:hypothetical protein KIV64_gp12 [Mycobacterium phage DroogsArmy]|uniref:Uncharacterized protein n=2 Tax=Timshelvirus TaxID=2948926 RepID=G1DB99_9CAUD|nr:hypothetical protein FDI10_gp13 [Mycobacterium phage Timshel]YP_010062034.1 hypothetical protein KIV64_gp12 [Mycobacterium phage DroogsArmy]AEJ92353.1 hypothetical protein TIMSHEL_81 [Mycobacterium phage Timshel]QKO02476.1 hypothetical protein SEA_DROOGSARMY_80 [Mycobacterium phage DroogsArmy]
MNTKRAIIPNASTDALGRPLALIVTPEGWEYVLQQDL